MSSEFIFGTFGAAVAVVFFRPLLTGLVKAAVLLLKPRRSRA